MSKIDLASINKKHRQKKADTIVIPQTKPVKIHNNITPVKKPVKIIKKENVSSLSNNEKYKKIKVLELYVAEFPSELSKYQKHDFGKCSDQQLIDLKAEFDKSITSKNNLHWGVSASQQALKIYEQVCKMGGLDVDGVSKLGQDPEWIKNVKAVCLKYLDNTITTVEPEHQLLFMLFQQTMTIHYLNTTLPVKKPIEKTHDINLDKIKEINDEYIDI